MPTSKETHSYPALERLTTDELEALVAKDFDSDEEPDMVYIQAIMEVIAQRDNPNAAQDAADTQAAWERFQAAYQGKVPPCDDFEASSPILSTPQAAPVPSSPKTGSSKRRRWKFGRFIIAAALVVILGGTLVAQAFRMNIWQAFAQWTQEIFHFGSGSDTYSLSSDHADNDVFALVREALVDRSITDSVVPTWCPEGFSLSSQDVAISIYTDRTQIYALLKNHITSETIAFSIIAYNELPDDYSVTYEKDENLFEYVHDDITYYIANNNKESKVMWTANNLECVLQGYLDYETWIKIIDSIYEEY